MTLKHQIRKAALRAGLDVRRASDTSPARIVQLLTSRGVDCLLDVGANEGQYGRRLRRFGYHGFICSFEPLPDAFKVLRQRARRDPKWSVHNVALGANDSRTLLNVAGNGGLSSSILPMKNRHMQAAPWAKYVKTVEVPIHRLDTLWGRVVTAGSKPFVKLDVQGFEGEVLNGAATSLERMVGIQIEVSLVPLYEGALSLDDVLAHTAALGMSLVQVEPGFIDLSTGELLQMDAVFMRSSDGNS